MEFNEFHKQSNLSSMVILKTTKKRLIHFKTDAGALVFIFLDS